MYFRSLLGFAVALNFNASPAFADCPVSPETWNLKEYQTNVIWQTYANEIVALQGVLWTNFADDGAYYATHGYAESNVSIWSRDGVLQKTARLGRDDPAVLIADVASDGENLWWTDYRNGVIFRTDPALEQVTSFEAEAWKTTLVGITYSESLDALIFPLRGKKAELVLADRNDPETFRIVALGSPHGSPQDLYDVMSVDGCLFIVARGGGQIYSLSEKDLTNANIVRINLLLDGLQRPQHMVIHNKKLYVIETEAHRVSRFDFETGEHSWTFVPEKRIFRGLAVDQDGTVVLSGFRDADDISEERTILLRLAFD